MSLIDNRGRLFGRLNIIDAALIAFVLVLLPIAYTASRLFRIPKPQIESVEPSAQLVGPGRRIRLHGRDFRPFLRAFVSPTGRPFSLIERIPTGIEGTVRLETPSVVEVELPDIAAGTYDLYLFDETQEVARRPGAFLLSVSEKNIQARIRFSVPAGLTDLIKAEDVDVSEQKPAPPPETVSPPAVLKTLRVMSPSASPAFEMQAWPDGGWFGWMASKARVIEADVVIPAKMNPQGVWEYRGRTIRAGDMFLFQTAQYSMRGLIDQTSVLPPIGAASVGQVGK